MALPMAEPDDEAAALIETSGANDDPRFRLGAGMGTTVTVTRHGLTKKNLTLH